MLLFLKGKGFRCQRDPEPPIPPHLPRYSTRTMPRTQAFQELRKYLKKLGYKVCCESQMYPGWFIHHTNKIIHPAHIKEGDAFNSEKNPKKKSSSVSCRSQDTYWVPRKVHCSWFFCKYLLIIPRECYFTKTSLHDVQ